MILPSFPQTIEVGRVATIRRSALYPGIFVNDKLAGQLRLELKDLELSEKDLSSFICSSLPAKAVNVAYWVDKACEGRGVISRCLAALLQFAIEVGERHLTDHLRPRFVVLTFISLSLLTPYLRFYLFIIDDLFRSLRSSYS
jgi:hypothetical protein